MEPVIDIDPQGIAVPPLYLESRELICTFMGLWLTEKDIRTWFTENWKLMK
jgi:hypothetical protein